MSLTSPEQPAQGQDQATTPDPTPAAAAPPAAAPAVPTPAAPTPGSAPWAQDLNAIFTDEATRGQVDSYLREKVQPYTTQLEQQAAQAKDALNLWQGFSESPIDTYVAVTEELFGQEQAQELLTTIQRSLEAQQETPPPATPGTPGAPVLTPEQQEALDWANQQRYQAQYSEAMAQVAANPDYADVNTDLLHPFVAAANGDFDQAVVIYRQYQQQAQALAADQAAAAAAVPPVPGAPNVLGSDTNTTTPPSAPTEPRKQTLDEAITEFVHENRPGAAPPVGTV